MEWKARTGKTTWNSRVVCGERHCTRHGRLVLHGSFKDNERRIGACNLTPVDAQEDALLGGTRGDRTVGGRYVQPGHVALCSEGKRRWTTRGDVNKAIPTWYERVDGH